VSETQYDAVGNPIVAIDANGQVTKFLYNERNLLKEVQQSTSSWTNPGSTPSPLLKTTYTYGHLGDLTRVTRAQGDSTHERATEYAADGLGRVRSLKEHPSWPTTTSPLTRSVTYDLQGNRASVTDPLGQTTSFSYDALGRLTNVNYSDSGTADVTFTHDFHGNRLTMVDDAGTTSYAYDPQNRLLSVTRPGSVTVGYRYDRDGHRTKVIYPGGSNAVTSTFDNSGRLTSLADWGSRTTGYTYFPTGQLKKTTHSNSTTIDYAYDNALRLTDLLAQDGTTALSRQTYTLDAVGNRTQVGEILPALGVLANLAPTESAPLELDGLPVAQTETIDPERQLTLALAVRRRPGSGAADRDAHPESVANPQPDPAGGHGLRHADAGGRRGAERVRDAASDPPGEPSDARPGDRHAGASPGHAGVRRARWRAGAGAAAALWPHGASAECGDPLAHPPRTGRPPDAHPARRGRRRHGAGRGPGP
jgi:YD repeat-containing protein